MLESLLLQGIQFRVEHYSGMVLLRSDKSSKLIPKIGEAIYRERLPWIQDVVPTQIEIGIRTNSLFRDESVQELENIEIPTSSDSKTYRLPVYFTQTEDWPEIEKNSKLSKEEVKDLICENEYELAMIGFTPGFMYMSGLDSRLFIDRKSTPTLRCHPGTIAIGGRYLGLYSLPTPAGWYQVGLTPVETFSLETQDLMTVHTGDKIIIETIEEDLYHKLKEKSITIKEYNA